MGLKCWFATFSGGVGWGGVEWVEKLEIKPTQPQFKFELKLGLSLAIDQDLEESCGAGGTRSPLMQIHNNSKSGAI